MYGVRGLSHSVLHILEFLSTLRCTVTTSLSRQPSRRYREESGTRNRASAGLRKNPLGVSSRLNARVQSGEVTWSWHMATGGWAKWYLEAGEWQKSQAYIIPWEDFFSENISKVTLWVLLPEEVLVIRIRVQKQEKEDICLFPLNRSLSWLLASQFVQHFCTTRVKSVLS